MSISEFTKTLRERANASFNQQAEQLLQEFVNNATAAFTKSPITRAASIISEGEAKITGRDGKTRTVKLREQFRELGERQGRTRLVFTEDDLQEMFAKYNITSSQHPMILYAVFLADKYGSKVARHFEVYMRDGSIIEKGKKPIATVLKDLKETDRIKDIIAVRGLNFSHANTIKHTAEFLEYVGAFPGMPRNDIEKLILGDYERGHVYAVTTGRAGISLGTLTQEENILSSIYELYELLDEGSTSLSALDGKYAELLARAKKDFRGPRIAMNIQMQLKRNYEGTGNQDSADISKGVRIVGFLQSLIKNSKLSIDGKRQLGQPASVTLAQFEKSLTDLNTKLTKYQKQITNILKSSRDPEYLVKLQTSDSLQDHLTKTIKNALTGKALPTTKVDTGNRSIAKSDKFKTKVESPLKKVKPILTKAKADLDKAKSKLLVAKTAKIKTGTKLPQPVSDLVSLQNLLNANLIQTVKQNMGGGNRKDILNLRSGRFAESVRVDRLTESKAGAITAFYTYMRNPYATFSDGGKQQYPKTRDPKLLISKSIRQLAQTITQQRLRAVLV
jgi:hypothetical protein